MSMQVPIEIGYEFTVKATPKQVFKLLSDVPASASHYPQVDRLVDLGDGAYRWEMEKIGVGQFTLQTVYASRYVSDAAKGTVVWTPVAGVGNAAVSGHWEISAQKKTTHVVLKVQAVVTLPLPPIMKAVVTPLLEAEFERLTETYIDNLIAQFGGEA